MATNDRRICAVIFDLDDTLVDTRSAFAAAISAAASAVIPEVPESAHAELLAVWRADPQGHYRRYTRGEIGHGEQKRARVGHLHQHVGLPAPGDEEFARWDAVYEQTFTRSWVAFDDAVACVQAVRMSGLGVGALTNADWERQQQKLEATGLAADVPLVVAVDTLGFGKPDPRVFTEACRRLGVAPAQAMYVGDELDTDARAAVRAGLHGVWLDRPGRRRGVAAEDQVPQARAEGVSVITGLAELGALLD